MAKTNYPNGNIGATPYTQPQPAKRGPLPNPVMPATPTPHKPMEVNPYQGAVSTPIPSSPSHSGDAAKLPGLPSTSRPFDNVPGK